MMKRWMAPALAAASLLAAPAHAQEFDASRLRPETLEYRVVAGGNPVGGSVVTLARDGEGWKSTSAITFGPMRQTIEARWGAAWQPLTYVETYAGPFHARVDARVENGRVAGAGTLPAQAGGPRTYDAEAVAGTAWSQMEEAMLSTADLAEGRTFAIPVFNSSTGAVSPVTFTVGAVESVTVPAGTFQAYRVQVTGGSSPLVLWLRADGPHVTVKQEVVGQPFVVELTAVR
jgi:Protein of unknown function (DUF3108)